MCVCVCMCMYYTENIFFYATEYRLTDRGRVVIDQRGYIVVKRGRECIRNFNTADKFRVRTTTW